MVHRNPCKLQPLKAGVGNNSGTLIVWIRILRFGYLLNLNPNSYSRRSCANGSERMPRASPVLRQCRKALQDLDLLKVLQSEITHELSSNRFLNNQSGSLGDFLVEWDSSQSQDVVLRRKCELGEEVVVSAILGPFTYGRESVFPRGVLMKVCLKKPGLGSILQFDCGVSDRGNNGSEFNIHNACYIQSSARVGPSAYRGPVFSSLDPQLQDALKEYLVSKGIGENLTNFLLLHLHKKEQGQYVNWLHKLESLVAKSE